MKYWLNEGGHSWTFRSLWKRNLWTKIFNFKSPEWQCMGLLPVQMINWTLSRDKLSSIFIKALFPGLLTELFLELSLRPSLKSYNPEPKCLSVFTLMRLIHKYSSCCNNNSSWNLQTAAWDTQDRDSAVIFSSWASDCQIPSCSALIPLTIPVTQYQY